MADHIEVDGESDLPDAMYYLRSRDDPRLYIHCHSGRIYVRRDGKPWEHGAYRINTDKRTGYGIGAYCDMKTYPYRRASAA